jgi:hypothetical protein
MMRVVTRNMIDRFFVNSLKQFEALTESVLNWRGGGGGGGVKPFIGVVFMNYENSYLT